MKLARMLLKCIGQIDETHIADAELDDVARTIKRRRVMKYSAVAVAASIGIGLAVFFIHKQRAAVGTKAVAGAKAA